MNKNIAPAATYGQLRLVPGACYRVVKAFNDYDRKLRSVGEEFVFLGVDVFPYDSGHTLSVSDLAGTEFVIRLQWQPEAQEAILESMHEYVQPVQAPSNFSACA